MKFNYLFFWSGQEAYIFLNFLLYILSDKSEFFGVKLSNIKTSFNTTHKQILRHVTDMWAEVVGSTIT